MSTKTKEQTTPRAQCDKIPYRIKPKVVRSLHFKDIVVNRLHAALRKKYLPPIADDCSLITGITDINETNNTYTLSGKYVTMENGIAKIIDKTDCYESQPNPWIISILASVKDLDLNLI